MRSIREHITLCMIGTIVGLIGLFGAGLYSYVRHVLVDQFDDALLHQAVGISSVTMLEADGHIDFELNLETTPRYQPSKTAHYFQVWYSTGTSLARSPSLNGQDLRPGSRSSTPYFGDMVLPDGRSGRVVEMSFTPSAEVIWDEAGAPPLNHPASAGTPNPQPMTVVVARERESLDGTLTTILGFFAMGTIVIAGGAALIVLFIVGRGMRPLQRMAAEVEAIGPQTLERRLPAAGLPVELQPIAEKLNGLLERIESMIRRERRFTADAAHELRTPVAELRTLTDVAATWPVGNPAINQALRDAKDIAIQMEALIAALLDLSRHDAGTLQVLRQAVDLSTLVQDVHSTLRSRIETSSSSVDLTLPATAVVETDPVLVRACLHNLMDNAIKHSPPGAHIACRLTASPQFVMLSIVNPCAELTDDDLRHIGEPFWQKDTARSKSERSGLGVALVKAYAKALSAELSLELDSGKQFVAQLRFSVNGNGGPAAK